MERALAVTAYLFIKGPVDDAVGDPIDTFSRDWHVWRYLSWSGSFSGWMQAEVSCPNRPESHEASWILSIVIFASYCSGRLDCGLVRTLV
jgi:hypothetical protein